MKVLLAQPRGFCAGVVRAIDIVERSMQTFDAPVYVRHEIVHNRHVVDELKAKGVTFVDELDQVPEGAVTVFSAHGVSRAIQDEAGRRGLKTLDATCPLVKKVHKEGNRYLRDGRALILIGHAGHPEVQGTIGQIAGEIHLVERESDVESLPLPRDCPVAYITQTTLSVDDTSVIIATLKRHFLNVVGPDTRDICYATQNRQTALRELCRQSEVVLVVGARNSSNSRRLHEIGQELGVPSYLIADATDLDLGWLDGIETVGLTAGASAPEVLVQGVIDLLRLHGPVTVATLDGVHESVQFNLPAELVSA